MPAGDAGAVYVSPCLPTLTSRQEPGWRGGAGARLPGSSKSCDQPLRASPGPLISPNLDPAEPLL